MALTANTTLIPGTTIVTDSVTGGIAIDYTPCYNRIATATESIAVNIRLIKELAEVSTANSTILSDNSTILSDNSTIIKNLAEGDGIKMRGPWEWLGMSSLVRLYEERGVDLAALKIQVEAVPKSF
jgi:hypothetical protein